MTASEYQALLPGEENKYGFVYFKNYQAHPANAALASAAHHVAWWCAQLSLLAYSDSPKIEAALSACGLKGKLISNRETHCILAHNANNVFLAFRGSPLLNLSDFGSIEVFQSKFEQFTSVWGSNANAFLTELRTTPPSREKVHGGFKQSWEEILGTLEPLFTQQISGANQSKRIWISGHSLGGALATFAAAEWQHTRPTLITFGSPRVGNEEFVRALTVKHFRYVNGDDAVTDLPPSHIGYQHHAEAILLGEANVAELLEVVDVSVSGNDASSWLQQAFQSGLNAFGLGIPASIVDHAPLLYVAQCEKKLQG